LHLYSGDVNYGQIIYWLVVPVICASMFRSLLERTADKSMRLDSDIGNDGWRPVCLAGFGADEGRVALSAWNKRLRRLQGVMKVMGEILAWGQLRSGGHDGSAVADELIAYGKDVSWRKPLLDTPY